MNEHSCRYEEGKYCSIQARLAHLCKSEFICRFDEISPVTGQYSLDISEADKIIEDANSVVANREEINAKIPLNQLLRGPKRASQGLFFLIF